MANESSVPDEVQNSLLWSKLSAVNQSVSIIMGKTQVPIATALEWSEGSLIELDKVSGEPVDVYVNDKLCFKGEVVTIAENFGVRITEFVAE